jgi:predicted KAP-like P-loop ATPase
MSANFEIVANSILAHLVCPKMSRRLPFALSDQPIVDSSNDRLGRQAFAKNLAHVIRHLDRDNSTVLALTGPWGTGKTSIKNLVIQELKDGLKSPHVLEFSPWQLSGTGNISTLFFEAILGEIAKEQTTPEESRKKRESVRKYAALISRGATGLAGVGSALSFLGMFGLPFASIGGNVTHSTAEKIKELSEAWTDLAPEEAFDLKQLKKDIGAELEKLDQHILVVIDDIDRLPIAEISEIVQLVNINANFPNLHYLLLFDRRTVENSLEPACGGRARQFLEKIIQASYHVPVLTRSDLEKEFSQHLEAWIKETPFEKEINKEDLTTVFDTVLFRFLGNVRHIKRLISSLSFYAAQFVSADSTDVNPVDLIALEALRQFEPDVYEALPLCKRYLTEGGLMDFMRKDEAEKERSDVLERLTRLASEERRDLVRDLITFIFPPIKRIHREEDQKWLKERKVCHSDIFDRYFTYRLGETDISQGDLDAFIRSADDRDFVLRFFEEQKSKDLLRSALERLLLQAEEITDAKAETVAKALVDFCDKLPRTGRGFYFQDEVSYGSSLFARMIGGLCSPTRPDGGSPAFQLVKRLLEETDGLYVPIIFFSELVRHLNNQIGRSLFEITTEQVTELSALIAAKIERRADDEFFNHPRFINSSLLLVYMR